MLLTQPSNGQELLSVAVPLWSHTGSSSLEGNFTFN